MRPANMSGNHAEPKPVFVFLPSRSPLKKKIIFETGSQEAQDEFQLAMKLRTTLSS